MTIIQRIENAVKIAGEKGHPIVQIDLSTKDFLEITRLAVSNANIVDLNAKTFRGYPMNCNDAISTSMIVSTGGAIFIG